MNFGEISYELCRIGKEYASAKAKHEMLSESKKSVIASIASKHEGTEAKRERIARASQEFKEYLAGVQQARQKELELRYELDALNMDFEYMRSMNSIKKKEMDIM